MALNVDQLAGDVRGFIQDDPELNVLLGRTEFSRLKLALAMRMMIAHFNRVHFLTNYSDKDFPDASDDIQIYGTIFHLLNSNSVMNVRNHLPYNDGGLSVGQFAKSGEYAAVADRFNGLFTDGSTQLKWAINMRNGFGGRSSEYSYSSGWNVWWFSQIIR